MDMTGECTIAATRQQVWDALNDPEILKQCIPGCESVDKTSETSFSAKVTAKVGPVKAKFTGDVTLSDLDPPNGYTISGEGKGGGAGFAKGGAEVKLTDAEGGGTTLSYVVNAQVGGKLAQIGSRLIDSTSKKMAGEFFKTFREVVENETDPATETQAQQGEHTMSGDKHVEENVYPNTHWSIWFAGAIAAVALINFVINL